MSNHAKTTPRRRKKWVVAATAIGVVAAAAGAYAYWTAGGTGSGSATTGTTTPVTVVQTTDLDDLAPGVLPQTLSGEFNNPNDASVYVGTVTISSITVTKSGTAVAGDCDADDYTLGGTAVVNDEIEAGDGVGAWTGLTIEFNNKVTSQDQCKGATVAIAYAVS
ncbi:MAG: hypothetical protein JWN84_2886 [Nocardioides sp.]|jgi:hypothetical protein|nr:hypothetical protein [Nocardioides sp.]